MGRRALILAGAVALAGCGSHAPPRVVPWLDAPLPPYRTPPAQLVRYPTSAPPCAASQLRLRNGRHGVGLGNLLEELVITNVGPRACLIRGYPTVTAVDASGARVTVHARPGGTYFGQLQPADIAPGGHVFLDFGTSNLDPNGFTRYRDVTLGIAGGTVRGPGTSIVVEGGLSMSRVGLPERYVQPQPTALTARLVVPATVVRGKTLRYTVVLRNSTARPVRLDPCPGYTQSLFTQSASVRMTLRLNCKPVATLAPHAQQRYAMQLVVPARASGLAKIGWSIDTANGPFAGGVVRVR